MLREIAKAYIAKFDRGGQRLIEASRRPIAPLHQKAVMVCKSNRYWWLADQARIADSR